MTTFIILKFIQIYEGKDDGLNVAVGQWDGFAPSCESVYTGKKICT